MEFGPAVLITLVIALLIAGILYQYWAAEQRRKLMRAFGRRLGLCYTARDADFSRRNRARFATLRQGMDRYAYNLLQGEHQGREIAIFDHHHTTSDGKHTHHHHRSMVLVRLAVDLGRIEMRPEHIGDKLASTFGFDDIDFESAEFSDRYHIKADDKKLAYAVFHPRMIEYLMQRRDIKLATAGDLLLARRADKELNPRELESLLDDALGFLERLPRFVRKDRGVS